MIVSFTVSCNREKYLRRALDSWIKVRGAEECRFTFALEPPGGRFQLGPFTDFVKRSFPGGADVHPAVRQLQCLANTWRAMELALDQEDFGIVAEEDLEVADDVLEYMAWARDAYRGDKNVLAVCAHARASVLRDASAVVRAPWFNPLVWGTWRDRWDEVISPNWKPGDQSNVQSWDLNLMLLTRDSGHSCVFPGRSRVIHFGESSTQTAWPLSEYFYDKFRSDCYAPHYEPQAYREVGFPPARGAMVV